MSEIVQDNVTVFDRNEDEKPATGAARFAEGVPFALTFDDVLLLPGHSDVHPNFVDTATRLTRDIQLDIPIISAAMDTVTKARLAIAIAQQGITQALLDPLGALSGTMDAQERFGFLEEGFGFLEPFEARFLVEFFLAVV